MHRLATWGLPPSANIVKIALHGYAVQLLGLGSVGVKMEYEKWIGDTF